MRPVLGRLQKALLLALIVGLATRGVEAKSSHFVVETNSVAVKEPASIAGNYEAAIGDVSGAASACWCCLSGHLESHACAISDLPSCVHGLKAISDLARCERPF